MVVDAYPPVSPTSIAKNCAKGDQGKPLSLVIGKRPEATPLLMALKRRIAFHNYGPSGISGVLLLVVLIPPDGSSSAAQ
jgi:hypothetical protein